MTAPPAHDLVDRNEILALGGPWKKSGDWLMMTCPCHLDGTKNKRPSLGLSETGVLKCFAGCSWKDVIEALRGPHYQRPHASNGAAPKPASSRPATHLTATYAFRDADGALVAEKGRFEADGGGKEFRWRLPGADGWPGLGDLKLTATPLYGAHLLRDKAGPVYFVEGEKATEACWKAGLLAVTHGGGASTKDFGAALEVLRGRDVYLWPDNDPAGHQYMALLQALLKPIARSLGVVDVPLPEKGDAYDYFAGGGSVEGVVEGVESDEPTVTVLEDDALRIRMVTSHGKLVFTFAEMEKTGRSLDAEVELIAGQGRPYSQRMNLLSSSARTDLRRDLESIYGKDWGWPEVLNTALAIARETFLNQDRGQDAFDIEGYQGEEILLADPLLADGPTIFFGDGSSMKSYIVNGGISLSLGLGTAFVGVDMPALRVMVIDYEDTAKNFKRRLDRVAKGMGFDGVMPGVITYWDGAGIPLKDQWEAIKRKCDKDGIGFIVVDSIVPACSGDPNEADVAREFFRTLRKIGRPSALIAHINKGGDTNKPFGSSFWHNLARRTWWVNRIQEEDSDDYDVGLYCRKVNDGRLPRPRAYHLRFEGLNGPVTFDKGDMSKPELMMATTAKNQIWSVLREPLTVAEIAEETNLSKKTVESTLTRNPAAFVKAGPKPSKNGGRPSVLWQRTFGVLATLPAHGGEMQENPTDSDSE